MPKNEVVDEGPSLEEAIANVEKRFGKLQGDLLKMEHDRQKELVDDSVKVFLKRLDEPNSELKDLFKNGKGPDQIERVLARHGSVIGGLFSKTIRSLEPGLHAAGSGKNSTRQSLDQGLMDIMSSGQSSYVLIKTGENLAFEEDDSFTIKAVKSVRRVFRWSEKKSQGFMTPVRFWGRPKVELIKVREVPFQVILIRRLGSEFQISFDDEFKRLNQTSYKLRQAFVELDRIARFNLESASAELEESKSKESENILESVQKTALGTADRIATRLQSVISEKDEMLKKYEESLQAGFDKVMTRIRRDCDFADTAGEIATRVLHRLKIYFKEKSIPLEKHLKIGLYSAKKLSARFWQKLIHARTHLGLETSKPEHIVGALDNATVQFAQNRVPPLYRRVFRFDPVGDEDFFVGRGNELKKFGLAKERWISGSSTAIGIHGPIGSGKTSLIQCALQRHFSGQKIYSTSLKSQIHSIEELIEFLAKALNVELPKKVSTIGDIAKAVVDKVGRVVFTLEGCQHLFERKIGGFSILHEFLRFMVYTRPSVMWILGFNEVGWAYLESTKNISKQFTYAIASQNMSRENLERVISVRHDITGYELIFIEDENLPRDLKWRLSRVKDPKKKQDILRDRFFSQLHEIADGNIFTALYYWLCSAEFEGEQKVKLSYPGPISPDSIRSLSRAHIASLLAILQHGSMTSAIHQRIFRSPLFRSESVLSELEGQKILTREDDHRFWPNPIVVPIVMKVLRERNLVYHD